MRRNLSMKYMKLGKTDIETSVVAFGAWGIGGGIVWPDMNLDAKNVGHLLDVATELGINYIDTAPVYGTGVSEQLLGEALKGRRDKFILQTKCSLNWRQEGGNFHYERDGYTVNNDTSAAAVKKDVEESLKRMQTDYLDVIVVHYVCDTWPIEETMGALQDLIKEGKVRAVGLSNSKPKDLDEYEKYGTVALVQEQYSLLAPYHGMEYFPTCEKHGTTFQVYGCLEEGFLTGPEALDREYPAGDVRGKLPWVHEPYKSGIRQLFEEWKPIVEKYNCSYSNLIEAWTLKQFPNTSLLVGFRREETMRDTVKCFDIDLTDEEVKFLNESAKDVQVKELDK